MFENTFNQANECLGRDEKMSKRDQRNYFVQALNGLQKSLFIDHGYNSITDFVEYFEERELNRNKYLKPVETRKNFNVEHAVGNLNIQSYFPQQKYCRRHQSYSHSEQECRYNRQNTNNSQTNSGQNSWDRNFQFFIDASKTDKIDKLEFDGKMNEQPIKIIFDTGSSENYVRQDLVDVLNVSETKKPFQVKTANGNQQMIDKEVEIKLNLLQIPDTIFVVKAFILPGLPTDINLGLRFFEENQVLVDIPRKELKIGSQIIEIPRKTKEKLPLPDRLLTEKVMLTEMENFNMMLKNYEQNINEYGLIPGTKHKIKLLEDKNIFCKPYAIPHNIQREFEDEISRLLNLKIIQPSHSEFASPCFPIRKASGEIRLVVDFRILNRITKNDPYPLPRLDDIFMKLKSSNVYSHLDMRNGYYQIAIDIDDIWKTAFVTPNGHFEFLRMPFGLSTVPRTFQRTLANIFYNNQHVIVFLDDLLIHNKSEEEHLTTLNNVFRILIENNLQLNLDKCKFFTNEIRYLGSIISKDTISPDLKLFEQRIPNRSPKSFRELRRLVGFVNWFRPYVPNLSSVLAPLNEKLKNERFSWDSQDDNLIENIHKTISNSCALHIPEMNQAFDLYTNASKTGLSGVLIQGTRLIRIYSAKLTDVEERYSAIEKEMLAIVKSLISFRCIVLNTKVYIHSDNANLQYDSSIMNSRIQRWKMILSDFEFIIVHISGKDNLAADFISRIFEVNKMKKKESKEENLHLAIFRNENSLKTENERTRITSLFENRNLFDELSLERIRDKQNEEFNSNSMISFKTLTIGNIRLYVDSKDRVIIPRSLETGIIEKTHKILLHPGENKAYNSLVSYITFPQMKKKISCFTKLCGICQKLKDYNPRIGAVKGHLHSNTPFKVVSTDLYGPIDLSAYQGEGKASIITLIDFFSRTIALDCLERTRGIDVVESFQKGWLSKYPTPTALHSDQGPQFTSDRLLSFCSQNNIRKTFSSAYNPSSNSKSERINQSLKVGLRILRGERIQMALKKIETAMNLSSHRILGHSPFEVIGKVSVFDPLAREPPINFESLSTLSEKASLAELRRNNSSRVKSEPYKIGEFVYAKNFLGDKHEDPWLGPFEIVSLRAQKNSPLLDQGLKKTWINIKHVKPAYRSDSAREESGQDVVYRHEEGV